MPYPVSAVMCFRQISKYLISTFHRILQIAIDCVLNIMICVEFDLLE